MFLNRPIDGATQGALNSASSAQASPVDGEAITTAAKAGTNTLQLAEMADQEARQGGLSDTWRLDADAHALARKGPWFTDALVAGGQVVSGHPEEAVVTGVNGTIVGPGLMASGAWIGSHFGPLPMLAGAGSGALLDVFVGDELSQWLVDEASTRFEPLAEDLAEQPSSSFIGLQTGLPSDETVAEQLTTSPREAFGSASIVDSSPPPLPAVDEPAAPLDLDVDAMRGSQSELSGARTGVVPIEWNAEGAVPSFAVAPSDAIGHLPEAQALHPIHPTGDLRSGLPDAAPRQDVPTDDARDAVWPTSPAENWGKNNDALDGAGTDWPESDLAGRSDQSTIWAGYEGEGGVSSIQVHARKVGGSVVLLAAITRPRCTANGDVELPRAA